MCYDGVMPVMCCYGGVLYVMVVYCVVGRCAVWYSYVMYVRTV